MDFNSETFFLIITPLQWMWLFHQTSIKIAVVFPGRETSVLILSLLSMFCGLETSHFSNSIKTRICLRQIWHNWKEKTPPQNIIITYWTFKKKRVWGKKDTFYVKKKNHTQLHCYMFIENCYCFAYLQPL